MDQIPVLIDLPIERGLLQNGRLLTDMPEGIKFVGKFGSQFSFEMDRHLATVAERTEDPVALIDLNILRAVQIKPASIYPRSVELLVTS